MVGENRSQEDPMEQSAQDVRIGIIGAGRMGTLHADHLRSLDGVRITAVCDVDLERARELAGANSAAVFSKIDPFFHSGSFDAVYICTPTDSHADPVEAALLAGLPVFVEKPLEMDLGRAGRLVRLAEEKQLPVSVGFHWRYSNGYRSAIDMIAGKPIALVNLRWYWTRPPKRWMWERARAGGQIVDQNIHLIDLARGLAGEIDTIYAAYNEGQVNQDEGFDNWDGYAVCLTFKHGAVGTCAGTYALFPEIQPGPCADFALRDQLIRITDRGAASFTASGVEEVANNEPFHLGINRSFISAVRSGDASSIRSDLRSGLRSTAAALAANVSAREGRVVHLDQFIAEETGIEVS